MFRLTKEDINSKFFHSTVITCKKLMPYFLWLVMIQLLFMIIKTFLILKKIIWLAYIMMIIMLMIWCQLLMKFLLASHLVTMIFSSNLFLYLNSKNAIFQMNYDKSPSLDELNPASYKHLGHLYGLELFHFTT